MAHGKSRLTHLVTDDGRRYVVREEKTSENSYGRRFMIFFTDELAAAAARLGGTDTRVLLVLPKYLNPMDFRTLRREDLAADLKIAGSAASNALRRLHAAGYIERKGTGPATRWRLSLDLVWQDKTKAWHKERRARAAQPKIPPKPKLRVIDNTAP